jgi:CHAT domain-containing protein
LAGPLEEVSAVISRELEVDGILAALPPSVRRLRIWADGAIRNLPAAAWIAHGRFLVEEYAIAHDTEFDCLSATTGGGAVLGAPVALAPSGLAAPGEVADLSWLPDVEWIRRSGRTTRILDAPQITVANLAATLPGAAYLHFVGHGKFDPYRPEQSGLVLVSAAGTEELFGLAAIENARCGALQHATITACWGADAYALPGRVADGIAEAFRRAGARSVLASMWPADPAVADRLTRQFTANLGSMRRDEALRAAQLAMIADGYPAVHWAGWQLLGDPSWLPMAGPLKDPE